MTPRTLVRGDGVNAGNGSLPRSRVLFAVIAWRWGVKGRHELCCRWCMTFRAAFLAVMLSPVVVQAQAAPPAAGGPSAPAAASSERWYGWQTLGADGASLAMAVAGFFTGMQSSSAA